MTSSWQPFTSAVVSPTSESGHLLIAANQTTVVLGFTIFLKVTLLSSVDIANLFYTDVTGVLFNKSHTKLAG
jgi:hypothetical protein